MKDQDFHESITTDIPAEEAFDKISSVGKWWTVNFKGSAKNLNDIFTLRFVKTDFL